MEGAARAAEREHERRLLVAHHGAAWTGAAYAGKLKQFAAYRKPKPGAQQSPRQMLGALMAWQGKGAPMDIRQVN